MNTNFFSIPTGKAALTCLLGSPVSHSISPSMHNESFRLLNIDCVYTAFQVTEETFESAVEGLRALGVLGFNCTMPLKRLMYEKADILSESAKLSGAVNTVVNDHGILIGHNTDGYGFLQSVRDYNYNIFNKKYTILGAGGAASAILAQAVLDGAPTIDIFARFGSASTLELEKVISRINSTTTCNVSLYDLKDEVQLKQSISESSILINASSVGMHPNIENSLIPDTSFFHPDLVVGDVIYNPRETQLLKDAKTVGCPCINGMYMLLHQGAKAFELWTGQEMPVEIIREKYFK